MKKILQKHYFVTLITHAKGNNPDYLNKEISLEDADSPKASISNAKNEVILQYFVYDEQALTFIAEMFFPKIFWNPL